jgi:hypothetical protein
MKLMAFDAQYLVATVMAQRDDDSGHTLVNVGTWEVPEGMRVESVGPHRFVAMRDLAYYGAHGRVREED